MKYSIDTKSNNPVCKVATKQMCGKFAQSQWLRIAAYIDGGFFGTENVFSVVYAGKYFLLSTGICDNTSLIRVYCDFNSNGFEKIERLGCDTDGYSEIHQRTYERIQQLINEIGL